MPSGRPGGAGGARETPTTGEGRSARPEPAQSLGEASLRRLTIVVPGTPDKRLTPNAARRTDWHVKAEVSRELRHRAMIAALGARHTVGGGPLFAGPVALTERIRWGRGERRTDVDAIPHMLKAAVDGLCDAQIVAGDGQIVRLIVEQDRAADGVGGIELTIEEVSA